MAININNGVPGNTTGNAVAAGYVGQVVAAHTNTGVNLVSNDWTSIATITLSAGLWAVSGSFSVARNGASLTTFNLAGATMVGTLAEVSSTYASVYSFRGAFQQNLSTSTSATEFAASVGPSYIKSDGTNLYFSDNTLLSITPTQQVKLWVYIGAFSTNTPFAKGKIEAIRIA